MINSNEFETFWKNKKVFLTGHTGFKGSWFATWLGMLGADVVGVSLPAQTDKNLFDLLDVQNRIAGSSMIDVRNAEQMKKEILRAKPDVVFHLAAQALVRTAYHEPLDTISTNVMGTANILDAVRQLDKPIAFVAITTDKVYRNNEWVWPYRENDPLGGHEPYSASKSACELIIDAYRDTYFNDGRVKISAVRAGNVIGGGDWAKDRLVPDAISSFIDDAPLILRNPKATRPWQHVFEPLLGYMLTAQKLLNGTESIQSMNFGPDMHDVRCVDEVSRMLAAAWGGQACIEVQAEHQITESQLLALDNALAKRILGWTPTMSLDTTVKKTAHWYRAYHEGEDMEMYSITQLQNFQDACFKSINAQRP